MAHRNKCSDDNRHCYECLLSEAQDNLDNMTEIIKECCCANKPIDSLCVRCSAADMAFKIYTVSVDGIKRVKKAEDKDPDDFFKICDKHLNSF